MAVCCEANLAFAQEPRALPPVAEPPPVAVAAPSRPKLAGYHDGYFYMRDEADDFRLYLQGRVQVDSVSSFGPGVSSLPADQALKSSFYLRRARLELAGELLKNIQWQLSAEFAPTAIDNPGARTTTLDCTIDPVTSAQSCVPRTNAVEAPSVRPIPTDVFINYAVAGWLNLQAGQFFVPFSYENRMSENTTPFIERAVAVRLLGAPTIRDIGLMMWGETPNSVVVYNLGVFNGDGPNRLNADNRYDVAARVLARPFITRKAHPLNGAQLGVSGRVGSRDKRYVGYDVPTLTTQGGYAFWKPTYKSSNNDFVHILPSGDQAALGVDLIVPISIFDFTSEVVYAKSNTREAIDGTQLSPFTERFGTLAGYSYYVELGAWLLGDRSVIAFPGYSKPVHVDLDRPVATPKYAVQALAKFEQLHLTYDGASRSGASDSKTPNGDIALNTFSAGVNVFATKHFRLSLDYVYNVFPKSAPVSPTVSGGPQQTAAQRAVAPAQNLVKGADDGARDTGHGLHEVMTRFAVQF